MLKVGLIGAGFMGAMHANCYKNIEGAELCAIADIREEKAKALAEGTNAVIYGDGKDLIANADVDIIDICLPTFIHAEYACLAMEKVKYVFVEKPVALTNEDIDMLFKKQEETGAYVQVGQVIRFWDEYVALKDMIESGKYGKIINANFRRISPTPTWGWNDWLRKAEFSGGAAQDLHIHDIDFVLSLFGEPLAVSSVKNSEGETNSYVATLMKYKDFPVSVEGTWNLPASYPFSASFRVMFEKACVENAPGTGFVLYTDEGKENIVIEKQDIGTSEAGGNISDLGGYYKELVYFTDCAKKSVPVEKATLKDAADSLRFLLNKELASLI
jgi:predicted dehydrogenase